MDKKNSIVAESYGPTEKTEQALDTSKNGRKWSARIVQNVHLIWLDNSIDENNEDCKQRIDQLRRLVNAINTFTDIDQCIDFLTDISTVKVFMIISEKFCQNIIPLIHDVAQLHTIIIFCRNKTRYEQWAKKWYKIKGVFTEISSMCEVIQKNAQECEQDAISISFVSTSDDVSKENLDQLDSTFMYTQILKEILLTIEFEEKHIKEFIDYCRVDKDGKLNDVNKLEREYHNKTPIWWYTSECFLYSTLNYALRLMDVDIIIRMGWFVRDLHRDIEQVHNKQFGQHRSNKSFTIYRGQGISTIDFDRMMKTKGGLISFNNFLSTSKDRAVSLLFAETHQINPDMVGVLFVMTIDPSKSITPFASIDSLSSFKEEDEVLFSMHTVFRIREIKPMSGTHRLFQVNLTLTSDDDKDLRVLTGRIREESSPDSEGWYRLGLMLIKMGYPDKAQQVYEVLSQQRTNEGEKVGIYNELGLIKYAQGAYKEAIIFYEKALALQQQLLPPDDPRLAASYSNIGSAYNSMGESSKALSFFEKALAIQQKSFPPNYVDLAVCYSHIGLVYYHLGEYSQALSFHEKALEIKQKVFPKNHPSLAASFNNIGMVYLEIDEYSKALFYHQKALKIEEQSLPPNHPNFAISYNYIAIVYFHMKEHYKALKFYEKALENVQQSPTSNSLHFAGYYQNIGVVYTEINEHSKALSYYEKAVEIMQKVLPPNHRDWIHTYCNIGATYKHVDEYSKALSFYQKALEINRNILPFNHLAFADFYNCIAELYDRMGDHVKALSSLQKVVEIRQQSLPLNHPDLGSSYYDIGLMYRKLKEYSKALPYYQKAVEIADKSPPQNHLDLASLYDDIGGVYYYMGQYSNGLSYFEKVLKIRQQSFPLNHFDLAMSYKNIGVVYEDTKEYSKALSYYEQALEVQQKNLPPNHPDLASVYECIGSLFGKSGKHAKALPYFEKALAIEQNILPAKHLDLAASYNNIGASYINTGNYTKARPFLERAVDIAQWSLPPSDPTLQMYRANLDILKKKL